MKKIPIRQIILSPKEPAFAENFGIRDVSDLLAGKDMVQELHQHDFYYILALKKGAGTHTIDFISHRVRDQLIFFMLPGQVHEHVLKAGSTGYLLEFKTGFFDPHDGVSSQLLRRAGKHNCYHPDAGSFKKLFSLLNQVFREYTGKPEGYRQVIKANLGIFFIELLRQQRSGRPEKVNSYTQERLSEFMDLVTTHMMEQKQPSFYAVSMHLSLHQLNTITRTTLGKTSSVVINEQMILEAKRNLLATTGQVKEIADQLGYEDVSYFIRFFKKHTGYTPDAFRQQFS